LHNAIVRHVVDCEIFSHGNVSFRLNFSLQGWQENLSMSDYVSEDSPDAFRAAGKFYLWEGRVIGEAVVVLNPAN
jgi:hypothetical protein